MRTFDCPLCGDRRGRGWIHLGSWAAGCFNSGCAADPRLAGGGLELARRVLGLSTRAEAWRVLEREYGGEIPVEYAPAAPAGPDFCRFPEEVRRFSSAGERSPMQGVFESFLSRQWGLRLRDAVEWGLGWCLGGKYSWRVVVPIVMGGALVGFQARVIGDREPKYLTSSYPKECGRPASAMLFNVDSLPREGEVLLVEGVGDVMRWHRDDKARTPVAVGLLGTALTPEKIALIVAARPERVVVGLDYEPGTRRRAVDHADALRAWGVPAVLGRWFRGKDAGAGADLEVLPEDGTLRGAARLRLEGW